MAKKQHNGERERLKVQKKIHKVFPQAIIWRVFKRGFTFYFPGLLVEGVFLYKTRDQQWELQAHFDKKIYQFNGSLDYVLKQLATYRLLLSR